MRSPSILALVVALLAAPPSLAAQEPQLGWELLGELSASFFFGNTEQTVVTTRTAVGRRDSTWEARSEARFTYGEASDADGHSFVSKRSWLANLSVDLQPFQWVRPFLTASAESSLEKAIDVRYNAGAGTRVALVKRERTDISLSAAVLGERTEFADSTAGVTLARWSNQLQLRHQLNDKLSLTHETQYRPQLTEWDEFTLSSSTSLLYQLSKRLNVTLSFLDNYDSQARARGARSNNDGQMVVGLLGTL